MTEINSQTQLVKLISQLRGVVQIDKATLAKYGSTVGELSRAGAYEELLALEARGGKLYRDALPHANVLLGSREGVEQIREQILDAIDRTGFLTRNMVGSEELVEDIARGYAFDTSYYPINTLETMLAALEAVEHILTK